MLHLFIFYIFLGEDSLDARICSGCSNMFQVFNRKEMKGARHSWPSHQACSTKKHVLMAMSDALLSFDALERVRILRKCSSLRTSTRTPGTSSNTRNVRSKTKLG